MDIKNNAILKQSLKLPKYFNSCLEDFKQYYKNEHKSRILYWLIYLSKVKIQFLKLKNKNISNSTLLQYLILLLLEKHEGYLSIKKLSEDLDCSMSQIIKNVKGLIYSPSYNPKKEIEKGIILANFDKKD